MQSVATRVFTVAGITLCLSTPACNGGAGSEPSECNEDRDCTAVGPCAYTTCRGGVCHQNPLWQEGNEPILCRPAAGGCDAPELCISTSPKCPPDALLAVGTECRASAGPCDLAEQCTGLALDCPENLYRPAGYECRAAAGLCDVADLCDGASPACPDLLVAAGTWCDPCDECDGSSAHCVSIFEGTDPHGDCTSFRGCDGAGACAPWTQQLGTADEDRARGVATDGQGGVYVAGYTNGDLDGNTSAGLGDIFLVKYDAAGTKQWTRQLGTADHDWANGVATDGQGGVYVAGYTRGSLDGNTSAGAADLFVVKYNAAGTKQWTRQLGTAGNDWARAVATDGQNGVYVAGFTFGDLDGNTSAGDYDLFLVKYDVGGTKQWTRQFGTADSDQANSVATDGQGGVYAAGYTYGDLDGNTSAGAADLFVVRYSSDGIKQ